jgi:excisionase family DNA binding protein
MMTRTRLSPAEVAAEWGVTLRTVRRMISDGRLTAYKLGPKLVRIRREDMDLAMHRIPAGE